MNCWIIVNKMMQKGSFWIVSRLKSIQLFLKVVNFVINQSSIKIFKLFCKQKLITATNVKKIFIYLRRSFCSKVLNQSVIGRIKIRIEEVHWNQQKLDSIISYQMKEIFKNKQNFDQIFKKFEKVCIL